MSQAQTKSPMAFPACLSGHLSQGVRRRGSAGCRSPSQIFVALVAGAFLHGFAGATWAAAADAGQGIAPALQDVVLQYRETPEVLVLRSVAVQPQSVPFPKEPVRAKGGVARGQIQWGPSETPMGFIWERDQRVLRLDLNWNRDLTDDPQGVFVGTTNGFAQVFTNIHLARRTVDGEHPLAFELQLMSNGGQGVNVYAGLCSFWAGKIDLQGKEWQFGLVEDALENRTRIAPVHLLLRPWAERDRPLHLRSSSADFTGYTTNLFLAERAYELASRFVRRDQQPAYLLSLREQTVALGDLKVSGEFLHRLILKSDRGLTVVLDQPAGLVRIPVASYAIEEVWLRKGETEAARFKAGRVRVERDHPSALLAGGPLTNSVKSRPADMTLAINYELLGADGGVYRLPRPDETNPPQLAIYQGTNRLAADKFRYG
jgi:hypothetical protein